MALTPQTIQFKRRVGSAGAPPTLAEGEPALNDTSASGPANLYIGGQGGGAAVRTLVSPLRQVEMTGTQTITTGAANAKTFDLTNLKLAGGGNGDLLQTDGAGNLDWADADDMGTALASKVSVAVTAGIALTGNGLTATPLNLTYATSAEARTGTDAIKLITPATLMSVTGNLTTLDTKDTTSLVEAINEIKADLDSATAGGLTTVAIAGGMLSGNGTTTTPLTLTPASAGDISTGTNTANPINSAGLRSVSGDLATLTSGITNTSLVAAINSLHTKMSDGSTVTVAVNAPLSGNGTTTTPLGLSVAAAGDITTGTNNVLPVTSLGLRGVTGDLATLTTSAKGTLVAAINELEGKAFAGISVTAGIAITGNGTTTTPLDLTVATDAQVNAATGPFDNIHPVTPSSLRSIMGGAVSAAAMGTTAATVVPAIAELAARTAALTAAIVLIGTYDLVNVTPGTGSPFGATPGALPTAQAINRGWAVILTAAGPGVAPAPPGPHAVGDWLVSDGASWIAIPLHHPATVAANVAITAITGMTGVTQVQAALQWLYDNTLDSIAVDASSIVGDGLAAGTPLSVGTVDGGTYT